MTSLITLIFLISGPLYLPTSEFDGSKWIKYKVIEENNVSVPTHFFNMILENASDNVTCEGYL
ncbi:MAG: DNA/RNA non-specific endonuclease [Parachlamydiaceae bacterium]|nr:DNA/RNA non-specific endonuclease [Parachlamydiaceae bacterium]